MTEYVEGLAAIFQGIRLDNAHSTPIQVAQYLLRKARAVNPNLLIVAELFAGTREREIIFINKIGLNTLVRESIYAQNGKDLATTLYKYGGAEEFMLGKIDEHFKLYLKDNSDIKEISENKLFKL